MSNIFLSGVPGAGKTTTAEYIADHYGYNHIEMEAASDGITELRKRPASFLGKLATDKQIISWGFRPYVDNEAVHSLVEAGFKFVWLDGDRVASFREFMQREAADPISESLYYKQMHEIVSTELVQRLAPTIINPFDANGQFRDIAQVAGDIIAASEASA